MKKEIGGYLELERFTGEEYHAGLQRMNLGRTALVWLLKKLRCDKIYIPLYNCDSVMNSVQQSGIKVELFSLDDKLKPVLESDFVLGENEWLYVINYYGQLTEDDILEYKKRYDRIIVDNAQAFFDRPVENVPTIYSCRKFLGVSDGAYLSTNIPLDDNLPIDKSMNRVSFLLGRMEDDARTHYSQMLEESNKFAEAVPMKMSRITENILRGINYEAIREKRLNNYRTLHSLLGSENSFTRREPVGPFAYPCLVSNGVSVRKKLASMNIFVPTNWSYLISRAKAGSLEKYWSENILPLPVDQRYGREEMMEIAAAVKQFI